jgi:hypothetical protein
MLIQALLTMAIIALLAGTILTSSLVAARSAIHEQASRHVQFALDRGTNVFTTWAAHFVRSHTASGAWPTLEQTTAPESMCDSAADHCHVFATVAYRITGSSAIGSSTPGDVAGVDEALNLQSLVHEQRVSAEVTATVTNDSGVALASGTREITARVFDVSPWVVVTGARNVTTVLGSVHAAEGDTAGVTATATQGIADPVMTPDPQRPSNFQATVINVTMTCSNSVANGNQSHPRVDNRAPGNLNLPWGVQLQHGAYETPCKPEYGLSTTSPVPVDAYIPTDGNYRVGALTPATGWRNGSATAATAWPQ